MTLTVMQPAVARSRMISTQARQVTGADGIQYWNEVRRGDSADRLMICPTVRVCMFGDHRFERLLGYSVIPRNQRTMGRGVVVCAICLEKPGVDKPEQAKDLSVITLD